jgi:allophanate hydrolase subunit 1
MLFLTFAVTFLGIETVTKISFKGASIERDVTAAKEIRQDIRDLAKTIVEVVHGINATSITFSRARRATEQLEERLAALETLAEPDAATREQWRTDMAEQFSEQDVEDI